MTEPQNQSSHAKNGPQQILFICRANQARSPLAAALLPRYLAGHRFSAPDFLITSAGTDASEAAPVIAHMQTAAADLGVDLSTHRALALDRAAVVSNDLLLTMTEAQRGVVSRLQPRALNKTFTLKEAVRLSKALPAPPPERRELQELTTALHRHRALVPMSVEPEDVRDPDGLDETATSAVAAEIDRLVKALAQVLAPG
jgi:protein-tyrosine phosphatase